MTLSKVEHALGMMRIYLVECATQNDWGDHRADELAQTIAACLRQTKEAPQQEALERDPRLSRDVLRRAIRFVNDNLDSKLKWDEIASDVGLDPFTFGRGFKLATGMGDETTGARGAVARRYRARGRLLLPEPSDDAVSKAPRDHAGRLPFVGARGPATPGADLQCELTQRS